MMRRFRVISAASVAAMVAATALAGCGTSADDLPLPGTTVPGDSFELKAEFDDALNLAIGAKVKVNGIDVGKVKLVETKDFRAIATLRLQDDANIREGATARLRYNTPLGELFVDVLSPKEGRVLGPKDRMVPPVTSTAPTVEDALASASLLINGGGLEQLQVITEEVQQAVGERGPTIRQLLDRSADFLGQANATTANIDRVLRALAGASVELSKRQDVINRAVREITPAARVLRQNTDKFVVLLQEVVKLSRSANNLVGASRQELLSTIRQLGPVLDSFYSLRNRFDNGLRLMRTTGDLINRTIPGDFGPVHATLDLGNSSLGEPGNPLQDLLDDILGSLGVNP